MKIIRVLNTNSMLAKDQSGDEIILPGAGIGFKHKPGDDAEEEMKSYEMSCMSRRMKIP